MLPFETDRLFEHVTVAVERFECLDTATVATRAAFIVQELCESRGGRPGLSILTSLLVSVDVKNY